jgi:hypothetical protein
MRLSSGALLAIGRLNPVLRIGAHVSQPRGYNTSEQAGSPIQEFDHLTAPLNTGSIAFHTRLGFVASAPIPDYDGPEDDQVAFKKVL